MAMITHLHTAQSLTLTGTVKWFDSTKGFGFVVVDDFAGDFLLHQNVLQGYGQISVADGATIEFRYEESGGKLRVVEVMHIDGSAASIDPLEDPLLENITDETQAARVKWFNKEKGYGFVNLHGSREDIFVGFAALRGANVRELTVGQALSIQTAENEGRKVVYRIHEWS